MRACVMDAGLNPAVRVSDRTCYAAADDSFVIDTPSPRCIIRISEGNSHDAIEAGGVHSHGRRKTDDVTMAGMRPIRRRAPRVGRID